MNYLAVLVAAIASMAVGMVWYSPAAFGTAWLKALGWDEKQLKKEKKKQQNMVKTLGITFVCMLITSYVLSVALSYWQNPTVGVAAQVAFWLWLGFIATAQLPVYLFERRSLKLFAINAAHQLVYLLVTALVLAAWL